MTATKANKKYRSVMLIDDSKFDNIVNQRLIEIHHFAEQISVFYNGNEAFNHFKQINGKPTNLPDLIFLDINMPFMDGFEFLDAFATLPATITKNIKVVMLTSSINPEDEARSVRSGFVKRYLHKPLSAEKLENLF